jgi:RNA polymerase sigma-70 factor (ECF subfamily)
MDDRRARFEAQILPHLDAAYRFASWLARSPDLTDDIVQESMLRAYRAFDSVRGSNAKAWLLAIVRNCCLSAIEQRQRHLHVPLPEEFDAESGHGQTPEASDPESASIRSDERRELSSVLSELPDQYREVLVLREIEDMGYREIALATNVPIGTVMSRLARARSALKKQWLDRIGGEARALS